MSNVMPLTRPQWSALASAATREIFWGLRAVSREVHTWRVLAETIPDEALRADARDALIHKRGHTNGAAFFWTLLDRRHPTLLRTLVAYEVMLDYLDGVSERSAGVDHRAGDVLFGAAVDALDLGQARSECRVLRVSGDDGGFLAALVDTCRHGCSSLPSYAAVKPLLLREARRASVLGLNHDPDPTRRMMSLQAWIAAEVPDVHDLPWYEVTGAASGWLMTHMLLALAADPTTTFRHAERVYRAYFPWIGLAVTMLDSYVDQVSDRQERAHSYISYYANAEVAEARLVESIQRAALDVRRLPNGERHAVLLSCMVALYLSKDSARTYKLQPTTARIAAAGGTLPKLLVPILRIWRLCNAQSAST